MRKMMLSAILMCSLTGAIAVAADKVADKVADKAKTPATQPAAAAAVPINKFCAVETDNPVDSSVPTVTYQGKVIGFCCEDCIPKFKRHPERYMKDLK